MATANNSSYQPYQFGAYHMIGNDNWEPQRTNNFEIHKLNDKGYDAHCDDKDLNNEIYFDKFNFGF
jgi:hypothetical protein